MTHVWVVSNVDEIVFAFDSDPTEDEVLDTINHYHGQDGEIITKSANVYTWKGEDQIVEYTLIKTDLL